MDVQIPIFTLQPLVENAVKHGLLAQEQGGTVTILIKNDQNRVLICINDNGQGIAPELLSKIMTHGFGKGAGVGLSNVNERLKVIYGPQYALAIDSVLGIGTNVRFSIPIKSSEGVVA
ncbi:Sensor histidine kinase YpdA [bioreactor metagenome]|uniref:Sensor histidine kinase YpdA n=1 Tax=bioreactor metagenome TaxID=1076179 RepID=A0A645FZU9_9ZZZZ